MLDLNELTSKIYELKDTDGNVLKFKKPSQALLNRLVALQDVADEEAVDVCYTLFLEFLNTNTNGITYEDEYVEQFDVATICLVITDYLEFGTDGLGELESRLSQE